MKSLNVKKVLVNIFFLAMLVILPTLSVKAEENDDYFIEDGILKYYYGTSSTAVIPDGVTSIDIYAFSKHTELTTIIIPDSVTLIRQGAFSGCTNLTSVNIPDSVLSIGLYAFENTPLIKDISSDFTVANGNILVKYNGKGGTVTIPDGIKHIAAYAFSVEPFMNARN